MPSAFDSFERETTHPSLFDNTWCGPVLGGVGYGVETVLDELRELPGAPYAVFDTYELVPSETPELPPDPDQVSFEQWVRDHPDETAMGGWYAHPPSRD